MHVDLNFGANFDKSLKLADFSPCDSCQEMPRFSFPDCSMTRRQTPQPKSDPISSFLFQDFRSQSILEESSRVSKVAQLKMSGWSPVAISASAQRYITSKSVWFSKKILPILYVKWTQLFKFILIKGNELFTLAYFSYTHLRKSDSIIQGVKKNLSQWWCSSKIQDQIILSRGNWSKILEA